MYVTDILSNIHEWTYRLRNSLTCQSKASQHTLLTSCLQSPYVCHRFASPLVEIHVNVIIRPCPVPPLTTKAYIHARTQVWKTGPFRSFWTTKTPLFQLKSPIFRSNKTPLSRQNAFFSLNKIKYHFCKSKNSCIKLETFFYVHRIFITSNVCLVFRYIYA